MRWCDAKLGASITLSGDMSVCERSSQTGWGVQLASEWLTKDITTTALSCDQLEGEAYIGVVGRNFFPSDWNVSLGEVKHAVAINASTGRFSVKGANTSFVLRPIKSGARLNVIVDMQVRELTLELVGKDGSVESSLAVEGIPGEVAIAVSFGPGRHSVRLVGSQTEKPAMKLLGKLNKDLWDEENVIEPLPLNVKKSNEASVLKQKTAEIAEAMSLQ